MSPLSVVLPGHDGELRRKELPEGNILPTDTLPQNSTVTQNE